MSETTETVETTETTETTETQTNGQDVKKSSSWDVIKKERDALKAEADKLRADLKTREETELRTRNDYKTLADKYENEAKTERERREQLENALVTDRKVTALREAAMKAGIKGEAAQDLELLDFPELDIETTSTGRISVVGVESAIARLKASRPHWFGSTVPRINSGTPETKDTKVYDVDDVNKFWKEYQKTKDPKVYENYKKAVMSLKK